MRKYILAITFLLIGIVIIPIINAENESNMSQLNVSDSQILETDNNPMIYPENESSMLELNVSDSQIEEIENNPMVSFDGLSDVKISESKILGYKSDDLRIPSSIKKYELLTIDIEKMQEKLANNEPITVRINGIPYQMVLHESMGDAIGLDPAIHSYRGILENVNNSEVALTITDQVVGGRIMLGGVNYFIEVSHKKENENHIDYVYSSLDVVPYDCNGCLDNDYLSFMNIQEISKPDRTFIELKKNNLEQQMATIGPVDVKILIMTDSNWINHEQSAGGWQYSATRIFDEAKAQLAKSDIQVNLIPIFDDSKATELADDPEIDHIPLDIFMNHVSVDYLNSKSADLAFYLGGFDCDDTYCYSNSSLGATYGYDNPSSIRKRYGWGQMVNTTAPGYSGDEHDRTVVTIHEIGHFFDGDHEIADHQNETYNRAFTYIDSNNFINHTVISSPGPNTGFDYSSRNNHGDALHDNARRINETKGVVANYFVEPPIPTTDFTATPRSGSAPLTVQFNDTSTNSPTAWDWNFGDEDVIHWSARNGHTSVVLPDGSIILMGGLGYGFKNDVWRSTDQGITWSRVNGDAPWTRRYQHTSVVLPDGSIVLMGGRIGDWPFAMNDTWRSTDQGVTWTLMNASSGWDKRDGHSSVVLPDGSIVLMGGFNNYDYLKDVWRSYDKGATWSLVNSSSEYVGWRSRTDHSSVVMPDGSIMLMGGYGRYTGLVNNTWRSTDGGSTWAQVTSKARWTARYDHTSVVTTGGNIVLMGGRSDGSGINFLRNDTWSASSNGIVWTPVNTSSGWEARHGHSSVALPDGSILLMGGERSYGSVGEIYNDIWRSTDDGATWTEVTINPSWTSQEQNPSHTYTTPGTYTVSLTTNAPDNNATTKTGYITVYLPVSSLPGQVLPPGDPDDDGMYEDVDGSGDFGYPDVIAFFRQLDWISVNEPVSAFDFNKNGRIEFDDIVRLNKKRLSQ
ncbi:MAG: kelch repeat-containing protein [Methanoregula sp.]|jgi:PKD repeat protein